MSARDLLAWFIAFAATSTLVTVQVCAADYAAQYDAEIRPLLKQYCERCHNHQKSEGKLNLESIDTGAKAIGLSIWPTLVVRFSQREMPPEGEPTPSDPERARLFQWMQGLMAADDDDCNKLATDVTQHFYRGNVTSRRLTRGEYNNTIRDLIGLDLKPADAFPADGSGGEGFDTDGDALFTNPILLEKYFEAAKQIVETAIPDGDIITLAGPIAAARTRLVIAEPSDTMPARDAARNVLANFTRRAYRRPVNDEDLKPHLAQFDRAQSRGDSYLASLRLAMRGVLVSPQLLFLVEPEPETEGIYPLGDVPLASRLSYFLWSSMPDDELLTLAQSGNLAETETLRAQVRRMLKDERARGFANNFITQWLSIDTLGAAHRPDPGKFPEFNDELAHAMKSETLEFATHVVRDDRSLLEFLDADYAYVNERLANVYGIADVYGPELRRVTLADRNRGGLLGMAAILTSTSYPLRTSPVLRGRWVLAEVLGSKVPPPPPNVPTLPADDTPTEGLTLRQRLEQHRKQAECQSCHNRLDPLGFGLENFDPIGRWRTEIAGQPVDSTGALSSGESFTTPAELKQVLLARKEEFLRNLTRKTLGYALGRELNRFDECVITGTVKALAANDYRSSILFEQIALSYPFRHRFVKK